MFWFWFIILNKSYLGISYSSHSPLALACYRFSSLLSHFSFFQLLGHCSGRGMNQEYFRLTDWRILFSTRILWRKKNHLENVSFSETLSNIFSITALNFYIFLKIYFFFIFINCNSWWKHITETKSCAVFSSISRTGRREGLCRLLPVSSGIRASSICRIVAFFILGYPHCLTFLSLPQLLCHHVN